MRVEQKLTGKEYLEKFDLAYLDSVIELFNRSGAFLDNHLKKTPDKYTFVSAIFKILEKIFNATEGLND